MNQSQFIHLLKIFPKDTDYPTGKEIPNYRIAFKIYVISHGLLPSVFFETSVEDCLKREKCKFMLNAFFEKYKLPMKANANMIFNIHLMPERKQKYLLKKYGFGDEYIGRCLGYPEILREQDFKLARKKNNPFYEIDYEVEFYTKELGLRKEWITGWMFSKFPNHMYPKGKPYFLLNLFHLLKPLKCVVEIQQTIRKI